MRGRVGYSPILPGQFNGKENTLTDMLKVIID